MIGILIIAHGTLGESLIHCANHVVGGHPPHMAQLGVSVEDDPNAVLPRARETIRDLDQGGGVLVLVDMYGATPSNIACRLLEPGRIEGVSGVNLPMLVRVLTYRNEPLQTVVGKALSGGQEGILHITMEACDVATRR
jgi:PTS system ascorbate-specific IIA component